MNKYTVTPHNTETKNAHKPITIEATAGDEPSAHQAFLNKYPKYRSRVYRFKAEFVAEVVGPSQVNPYAGLGRF